MQSPISALGSTVASLAAWSTPEGKLATEAALLQLELQLYIWLFGGFVSARLLYAVWLYLIKSPFPSISAVEKAQDQQDAADVVHGKQDGVEQSTADSQLSQQHTDHNMFARPHSYQPSMPLQATMPHVSCFSQPHMAITPPKRAQSCDVLSDITSPRDKPLAVSNATTRPHSWPESGLQRASRPFTGPIPHPPVLTGASPPASPHVAAVHQLHSNLAWQASPQQPFCLPMQPFQFMGAVEEEPEEGLVVGKDLLTAACNGTDAQSAATQDSSHAPATSPLWHLLPPQQGIAAHDTVQQSREAVPGSPLCRPDIPPLHLSDSPDRPGELSESLIKEGSPTNEVRVSLSGWNKARVSGGSPTKVRASAAQETHIPPGPQHDAQGTKPWQLRGTQGAQADETILIMVDSVSEQAGQSGKAPLQKAVAVGKGALIACDVGRDEPQVETATQAVPVSQLQLNKAEQPLHQQRTPIPRLSLSTTPGVPVTGKAASPNLGLVPQSTPSSSPMEPSQPAVNNTAVPSTPKGLASPKTPGYLTPATSVALPTTPSLQGSSTRPSAASSPASSVLSTPSTRPLPAGSPRYLTPLPSPRELAATLKFPLPKPVPLLPDTVVPGPAGRALAQQRASEAASASSSPAGGVSGSPGVAAKHALGSGSRRQQAGGLQEHASVAQQQTQVVPTVRASWDVGMCWSSASAQQSGFSFHLDTCGSSSSSAQAHSATAGVLHGQQHQSVLPGLQPPQQGAWGQQQQGQLSSAACTAQQPDQEQGKVQDILCQAGSTDSRSVGRLACPSSVSQGVGSTLPVPPVSAPHSPDDLQPKQLFATFATSEATPQASVHVAASAPPMPAAHSQQPQVPSAQGIQQASTPGGGYGTLGRNKPTSQPVSDLSLAAAAAAGLGKSAEGGTPGAAYGGLLKARMSPRLATRSPTLAAPSNAGSEQPHAQARPTAAVSHVPNSGASQASPQDAVACDLQRAPPSPVAATMHLLPSPAAAVATAHMSNPSAATMLVVVASPTAQAAAASKVVVPGRASQSPASPAAARLGPVCGRLSEGEQVRASSDSWLDELEAETGASATSLMLVADAQTTQVIVETSTVRESGTPQPSNPGQHAVPRSVSGMDPTHEGSAPYTMQAPNTKSSIAAIAGQSVAVHSAVQASKEVANAQGAGSAQSPAEGADRAHSTSGAAAAPSVGATLQSHMLQTPLSEACSAPGNTPPPYCQEITQVVHEFVASAAAAARSSTQCQGNSPRSSRTTNESVASANPEPGSAGGCGGSPARLTAYSSNGSAQRHAAAAVAPPMLSDHTALAGLSEPDAARPESPQSAANRSLRAGSVACTSPARSEQFAQDNITASALRVKAAILEQANAGALSGSTSPLLPLPVRMSQSAGGVTSPQSISGAKAPIRRMSEQQYQLRDQRILSNRYVNVMGTSTSITSASTPPSPQFSMTPPAAGAQCSTPGKSLGAPVMSLLPPPPTMPAQPAFALGGPLLRPAASRTGMVTPTSAPFSRQHPATPGSGTSSYGQQHAPAATNLYAQQQACQWQTAWADVGFFSTSTSHQEGHQTTPEAHTPAAQQVRADFISPPRHQELGLTSDTSPGNTVSPGTDAAPSAGSTPGPSSGMLYRLPALADVV